MSKESYRDEVTKQSFKELGTFASWMSENKRKFVIIGGWAVFAYVKDLGSRDIDVIIEKKDLIEITKNFFQKNKYEKDDVSLGDGIGVHYFKTIKLNNGPEDIHFELFYSTSKRVDVPGLNITMEWEWSFKYQRSAEGLPPGIKIPMIELLITQKIIAALDRARKMRFERNRMGYYISKIWKDYFDVAILAKNYKLNKELLNKFFIMSNVNEYLPMFLNGYNLENHKRILLDLRITQRQINNSLSIS